MTQYETHIQRYAPKGILGLGKDMCPCSLGNYVKHSDFETEQLKNRQLASSLDALRHRERQLDARIKQLTDDIKLSEQANLDLVKKIGEDKNGSDQRFEAIAAFVEITDDVFKTLKGKKGKALQNKYLEARAKLA